MLSRLVLVGMVTALGITVPTWPEIRGWMGVVHTRTAYLLADRDHSTRPGSESAVVTPWPARQSPLAGTIDPEDRSSIVDALNRFGDGLHVTAEAFVVRDRPGAHGPSGPSKSGRSLDFRGTTGWDAGEREILAEFFEAAERSKAEEIGAEPGVMRRSRRASVPRIPCVFSASTGGARRKEEWATRPELIEPMLDSPAGVAETLNRFADGVENAPRAPIERAAIRRPFEPIDPVTPDRLDLADELNRSSDGCSHSPLTTLRKESSKPMSGSDGNPLARASRPGASSSSSTSPELATALALTRDAVHAWMRLLTGPAVVQVSAR
jgi:hypothetical protein